MFSWGERVEREICSLYPIPLLSFTRHGKAAEVPVFLNVIDMFLTNSSLTFAVGGQHCNVSLVEQVVVKPQALEEPCTLPRTLYLTSLAQICYDMRKEQLCWLLSR